MHIEKAESSPDKKRKSKVGYQVLQAEKANYEVIKAKIIEAFPDLDDIENHTVLLDTLAGETNFEEVLVRLIHEARDSGAAAKALKDREAAIRVRRERFEKRAEKIRDLVKSEMVRIGRNKIGDVEVDVSVRAGKDKVIITGAVADMPDEFVVVEEVRKPNKDVIEQALRSDNADIAEHAKAYGHILKDQWVLTVRSS